MPNTRKADLEQLELLCVSRVLWLMFSVLVCAAIFVVESA